MANVHLAKIPATISIGLMLSAQCFEFPASSAPNEMNESLVTCWSCYTQCERAVTLTCPFYHLNTTTRIDSLLKICRFYSWGTLTSHIQSSVCSVQHPMAKKCLFNLIRAVFKQMSCIGAGIVFVFPSTSIPLPDIHHRLQQAAERRLNHTSSCAIHAHCWLISSDSCEERPAGQSRQGL